MVTGSAVPDDYRQRHPIVLANKPQTLDIFITSDDGQLNARQSADLMSFAAMFRAQGQGQISVLMPSNASPRLAQATLQSIREN